MSTGGPSESIRRSARALIVDHSYRILLCNFRSRSDETYWITPGGRCEERETPRGTLERELREEVGLELRTTQPLVWRQTIIDPEHFPGFSGVDNFYFLVRVHGFEPRGALTDAELRDEHLHGFRWWTLEEIENYSGSALFAPHDIAERLDLTLRRGSPRPVVCFGSD